MKSTGIVRFVDDLGRYVIPKEIRDTLGINPRTTPLEVYTDGEKIILKKYVRGCRKCGAVEELFSDLCRKCIVELYKASNT